MLSDTRKCHLCEVVDLPLSDFFCGPCFSIIKIGTMMRNLSGFNAPVNVQYMPPLGWRVIIYETGEARDSGKYTPALEQALESVGVKFLE